MFLFIACVASLIVFARGGPLAAPPDAPTYLVSIENFRGLHVCTGALIAPDLVITAAHCIDNVTTLQVRAGSRVLGFGGQLVKVKKNCPVEGYDFLTKDNDVALLRLVRPLDNSRYAQLRNSSNRELPDGTEGSSSAWGYSLQRELRSVTMEKLDLGSCKNIYGNEAVTANMICARYVQEVPACTDEIKGTPLSVNGKLVGVLSATGTCNHNGNHPSIYAKISLEKVRDTVASCI